VDVVRPVDAPAVPVPPGTVATGTVVTGLGTGFGVRVGTAQPPAGAVAPWSAGRVATVALPASRPTTDAPVSPLGTVVATTATPEDGVTASSTAPDDDTRWTDATSDETTTTAKPTGAPSATPKFPVSTSCTVFGPNPAVVGAGIVDDHTAWVVDNSRVSC
jgi:hypothetical protein